MRTIKTFSVPDDKEEFKLQLLHWGRPFEEMIYMDSNTSNHLYHDYDAMLAIEAFTALKTDDIDAFQKLEDYQVTTNDWLFGYLSYDLKNATESISSKNEDHLNFPELYFIQPKKIWLMKGDQIQAHYLKMVDDEIESDFQSIITTKHTKPHYNLKKFSPQWEKETYLERASHILRHIQRGDIYEVNFCQEFHLKDSKIDPYSTFEHLNSTSKAPFSSFLKLENYHALCASPERFLKKQGDKLISQPIKGTSKRGQSHDEDERLKLALSRDPKEISENVMIVDLVRNDLSKTALKSSVTVEELCKVYTYEQVHQMISTVTSTVKANLSVSEIIKSLFPMGSMTGAPKLSAMEISETYESTKRGLYSGCIGYITPDHNFDFNVVIRTLLYNSDNHYLSYMVGSALTSQADPEQEYEECLVKAKALQYVVNATGVTED